MEDERDMGFVGALLPLQLSVPNEINRSHVSSSVRSWSIGVYFRTFIYLATLGGFSGLAPQSRPAGNADPCDSWPGYDTSHVGRKESGTKVSRYISTV
jgi:hypothetical protein